MKAAAEVVSKKRLAEGFVEVENIPALASKKEGFIDIEGQDSNVLDTTSPAEQFISKSYKRTRPSTSAQEETAPGSILRDKTRKQPLKASFNISDIEVLLGKQESDVWSPPEALAKNEPAKSWILQNFGFNKNQTLAMRVCPTIRICIFSIYFNLSDCCAQVDTPQHSKRWSFNIEPGNRSESITNKDSADPEPSAYGYGYDMEDDEPGAVEPDVYFHFNPRSAHCEQRQKDVLLLNNRIASTWGINQLIPLKALPVAVFGNTVDIIIQVRI